MTGRTLTSFPSIRTDLRNAGANVVDQEAYRDENLATSRSPDDLFPSVPPWEYCPAHRRRKPLVSSPVRHMTQAGLTTGSTPGISVPATLL